MNRKISLLVDGNFSISTEGHETYTVSIDKTTSQITPVTTTAEVSNKLRSDNNVFTYLANFDDARIAKINEYIPVEKIGRFDTFVSKKDYKLHLQVGGAMEPITEELIASLKSSLTTVEKLKLELVSKPMEIDFGNRILEYGPTGTGKTYDFLAVANSLIASGQLEPDGVEMITISDGFEDIDFLAHIVPTDKGIMHVETRVVQLFREAAKGKKIAILLDELNRGNKAFLNLVLKMLDAVDGKTYILNNFVKNESIVVPIENVLFFATMNLGSKYVGTTALDEALLDRFNVVQYKGYDEEVEKEIIKKGFASYGTSVKKLVTYIREQNKAGYLRSPVSTRGIKMWAESFLNSDGSIDALVGTFRATLLYRLVAVNDMGEPSDQDMLLVEKKINELFIKKVTTTTNESDVNEAF